MSAEPTLPDTAPYFWDAFWDRRPAECPCDADFVAWLDHEEVRDAAIFHFGTGGHHHVDVECARPDRRNAVLGITASPQEHATFIELAIAPARGPAPRQCRLRRHLPAEPPPAAAFRRRDAVPHLRVQEREERRLWRADGPRARHAADREAPAGRPHAVAPGSFAWDAARHVVAACERSGEIEEVGRFRSLLVFRRAAAEKNRDEGPFALQP